MYSKKSPPSLTQQCWRYARILFLAIGLFFFGTQDAKASHFAGADITYTCVGPNQYLVTLTLYRDCDGVNMSASEFLSLSSASCGLNPSNVTLTQDTFYEVSQLCPSQLPNSSCGSGSGIYPGIEVYIYSGIVTFPQACTDWVISWSSCCRNSAITTLTSTGSMYVEAGINSTLCNSSPTFTSNPTPYFCAGQCYQYNHGAFDPDNDSLIYALTCPLQGTNNCISNIAGLSPTQPLFTNPPNSFGFNSQTGQMSFCTQTGLSQFAVAAVTVFQISNGDTVGYVQRDIQMIVLNSVNCTSPVNSNNPTVFTGGSFDTTANTFIVCAGETLIFDLVLYDSDGDTIQINPANTNLDAVFGPANWTIIPNTNPPFSHDSVQIFVQVVANPANIGVNNFTIGITDNACPVPGDQILGYNLIVPGVEVTASDTTICPGIAQQIQLTANSFSSVGSLSSGTFGWIQNSGTPVVFSDDTISSPMVSVPSNTVDGDSIVMTVTFTTVPDPVTGTQCVTTDDVVIYLSALPLNLNIQASDTSLCPNSLPDTISFTTAISGPGIDLVNGVYSWSASPGTYISNLTSTSINNPDAIVSGTHNDSVVYTINYTYGLCNGSDDIKLKWRTGEVNVSATFDTICPGDTTTLMCNLTDTITFSDPSACSTYTVAPITFAPISGSGSNIILSDDALTSSLSIGFSFDFYCNTYTQFRISSNGYITFDLSTFNNGCCTGQNIPNNFDPNNLIALAWEDLNPASGGTINYFTTGTAPNRKLVVNYINVPRFGGANNVTGQIVLHEGTNYIDVYTTTVLPDGNTTQGIENIDGTLAIAVPGRNSSQWTASNDAFRFSPGIAFLFGPLTYSWTPSFSVSNPTADNTDAFPQGTTTYYVEINEQGCIQQDSIDIFINSQIPPPTVTCGIPFNQATSVLFEWGQSPGATGWEYSVDSGITYVPVPFSDSFLLVTGLTNGDCANILVRALGTAGPCPTNASTYLECCTTPCPMPNSSTTTDLFCNGLNDGALQIAITGGVLGDHPNYTATLFDTTGGGIQVGTPVSTPDTALFTGLAAGTYYAYLQDTFGCFTYSDTVTITEPDSLIASLDSMTLTTCYDDNDGTASVLSSGGVPGYTWLWDSTANNQTTATATGLLVGVYQVVLSDSRGCTDTLSVNVNSPFPGPPTLTLSTTPSNTCTGNGTATVFTTINMVGDANNFNYIWSNADVTASATGLVPGVATVTVTDENGCVATATTTITGSASLSVTTTFINPGCGSNDGEITAVASGDSVGYLYQWSPNAFGQTSVLATGLPVGTYSVTVTGASNGCTDTATVTLTNNSALNIVGFSPANPTCGNSDGSILALTLGASGTLSFNWSDGQTTNPATGMAAGTYLVTVTDLSTNCSDIADTVLVEPSPTASFTTVNNPACNLTNGSITVTGANAPGPFTYLWSDGQTDATAQGLSPNVAYSCTVSYQGCTVVVADTTLTNDVLQISITDKDDIICNGDLASYANITLITGDSATTSYIWSNNATTQNISGLAAGTYTVTATSGNCTVTQSITVVDIVLTSDAWVVTAGQDVATLQLNGVADINGGLVTNHSNAAYAWMQDTSGVVTIADTSLISTTATALINGTSWLYFNATAGPCSVVDSVYITVESYQGMPTAFSPNGDGINDYFQPAGLAGSMKVFQFKIFNRWGQLLYDDALNHSWDGTYQGVPQPMEVYIYVFEYAPDNADPVLIRGEFTLIR